MPPLLNRAAPAAAINKTLRPAKQPNIEGRLQQTCGQSQAQLWIGVWLKCCTAAPRTCVMYGCDARQTEGLPETAAAMARACTCNSTSHCAAVIAHSNTLLHLHHHFTLCSCSSTAQHGACSSTLQHVAFALQHVAFALQHVAFALQHVAFALQHGACALQHVVCARTSRLVRLWGGGGSVREFKKNPQNFGMSVTAAAAAAAAAANAAAGAAANF